VFKASLQHANQFLLQDAFWIERPPGCRPAGKLAGRFPVALEVCAGLHADVALAIIQIAHEGPSVLGSAVLASPPLKFADNRLQELLHFDGLAF